MVDVDNLTESRITLERTSEHAYGRGIMILLTEVGRSIHYRRHHFPARSIEEYITFAS